MNENKNLFAALNDIDSLTCSLETIIKALGLFREQLDGAVEEMDTSTPDKAAIAGAMFARNYPGYGAALEILLQSMNHFKADLDTAVESAFEAHREEIGVKEAG